MWLLPQGTSSHPSFPSVAGKPGSRAEFVWQSWADQPLLLWAALLREEGKWTPCLVMKALFDPSSTIRLRRRYGHKALALAGSFMVEENNHPGKILLVSPLGVQHAAHPLVTGTRSIPDNCTWQLHLVLFGVWVPKLEKKKKKKRKWTQTF